MNKPLGMTSRNKNVFRLNAKTGAWTRVLFHDAGGPAMQGLRCEYGIPSTFQSIELDLTPATPCHDAGWRTGSVQFANIRGHTYLFGSDLVTSSLPSDVVSLMMEHLPLLTVERLIDSDYLPRIDMQKLAESPKHTAPFKFCMCDFPTQTQYLASIQKSNGTCALMFSDVAAEYQMLKKAWDAGNDSLTVAGLRKIKELA